MTTNTSWSGDEFEAQVRQILDVLGEYKVSHPNSEIEVRRQNSVSIRIRIIDPDFRGINWVDREAGIWQMLAQLPDEVYLNITMLLLLTPEEESRSLANQEFEHPIASLA